VATNCRAWEKVTLSEGMGEQAGFRTEVGMSVECGRHLSASIYGTKSLGQLSSGSTKLTGRITLEVIRDMAEDLGT